MNLIAVPLPQISIGNKITTQKSVIGLLKQKI